MVSDPDLDEKTAKGSFSHKANRNVSGKLMEKFAIFSIFILFMTFIPSIEAQDLVCPKDKTACCEKNENRNSIMCVFHEYEMVKAAEQIIYNHMNRVIPVPPPNPYEIPVIITLVAISAVASTMAVIVNLKRK